MATERAECRSEHVKSLRGLKMKDLRPELGRLNWKLRQAGVSICVLADNEVGDDSGEWPVETLYLGPAGKWTVTCDGCAQEYDAGTDPVPKCPHCGAEEHYSK